ncbi:DUF6998 domain-containing protein [Undibacterium flavidum]|uniref:DUF6998 domain-containing protein n=1 Tax=Undibacterium flavidum TaxID=2762297 RepID=A0ABR6Y7D6_9BURK|nr:hypothetical protein [Undibacterium flavidum]MBC3872077.1 hypothetical protein [Undibacterium flavidum]
MALTQMQVIQSLGEAMNWLERELAWGVQAAALSHLMGRIGELYVALLKNGQMANQVNERGYDVITRNRERISVKTTTMSNGKGHVDFNANTLDLVDRVVILRFNVEELEIEVLLDKVISEVLPLMSVSKNGKKTISLSKLTPKKIFSHELVKVKEAAYQNLRIIELENGAIEIYEDNVKAAKSHPILRKIAFEISVPLLNSKGNPYNTRQLGSLVISALSLDGS